jgi:hypothetical protein
MPEGRAAAEGNVANAGLRPMLESRYRTLTWRSLFMAGMALGLWTNPGGAEDSGVAPIGILLGGFRIDPHLDFTERFDDNVFAVAAPRKSDFLSDARLGIDLASNWSRHELDASMILGHQQYLNFSELSSNTVAVNLRGHLDITRNDVLGASLSYSSQPIPFGVPESGFGATQTQAESKTGELYYKRQIDRIGLRVGFHYDETSYSGQNGTVVIDGTPGTNVFSQNNAVSAFQENVNLSYIFSPSLTAFVDAAYRSDMYKLDPKASNTQSVTVLAGSEFNINTIFVGGLGIGALIQKFGDPTIPTTISPAANGRLTWNVTPITSFTATVRRDAQNTRFTSLISRIDTAMEVRGTHQLHHNIILGAGISHELNEYSGVKLTEKYTTVMISSRILVNRWVTLSPSYQYRTRSSTFLGNYHSNVIMVALNVRL